MNEIRLNELLNKIYYEYLDSHEAEEFIIYFKRLKNENERLNNIINELEKWLKAKQALYGINQQGFSWEVCGEALDKLKKLKEDKE